MDMRQLHKRLTRESVIKVLKKYEEKEINVEAACAQLGIGRRRFFVLLAEYRNNPDEFDIAYERDNPKRISAKAEKVIKKELMKEKNIIENPDIATRYYNYSHVRDILRDSYGMCVSLPTIISRAKTLGCYKAKKKRTHVHDREVITNYVGELVQHDSSIHLWSPYVEKKWYLITSIDDYSRYMLYATLVSRETSWKHISALESVVLRFGFPKAYYADQHSIFRYVKGRDDRIANQRSETDTFDPQWKQVILDCGIEPIYALSPQAKGKIERPYHWMQDRIVRTCAKEHISSFSDAQQVLQHEMDRYNNRQVHSTTKEIPRIRFERAVQNGQSLFRSFALPPRYESTKDLFALRYTRRVDAYRKISLHGMSLTVPKVPPRHQIDIRLYPDTEKQTVEVRFHFQSDFVGAQTIKFTDMPKVHF